MERDVRDGFIVMVNKEGVLGGLQRLSSMKSGVKTELVVGPAGVFLGCSLWLMGVQWCWWLLLFCITYVWVRACIMLQLMRVKGVVGGGVGGFLGTW